MLFKNVAAILQLNCLAVYLRKDKTSFCHGLTVWTICFVDIAVLFVLVCSELIFFFFLLFCIVYH